MIDIKVFASTMREILANEASNPAFFNESGMVRQWKSIADGKRTIVFCSRITQCEEVAYEFRTQGIAAEVITSSTPDSIKKDIIESYKTGEISIICTIRSNSIEEPISETECVVMLQRTTDMGTYKDFIKAPRNPLPGKEVALILDFAGNVARNGWPNE